jgi:hypothetical protein
MLLRAARSELRRRRHPVRVDGRELEDTAHQAADDALAAIISKLDGFRGESRFTTCAYKFVIFEVSAKLGRHIGASPRLRSTTMHGNASRTALAPTPHSRPSRANWRQPSARLSPRC